MFQRGMRSARMERAACQAVILHAWGEVVVPRQELGREEQAGSHGKALGQVQNGEVHHMMFEGGGSNPACVISACACACQRTACVRCMHTCARTAAW